MVDICVGHLCRPWCILWTVVWHWRDPVEGRIGQNSFWGGKDWVGLLRILSGASRIGQNSLKGWQEWSEILQEWAGLVKHSAGVCRIGQSSFQSGRNWSQFLLEGARLEIEWAWLIRVPSGMGRIMTDFLPRLAGLVTLPAGVGGITQNSFGNRQDWSEFLQRHLGVEF